MGTTARGLPELPLAAEPAPLPRDGRRAARPRGEGPAGPGLPRRRADGHRGADTAGGPARRHEGPAAQAQARPRARPGLQVQRQEEQRELHEFAGEPLIYDYYFLGAGGGWVYVWDSSSG